MNAYKLKSTESMLSLNFCSYEPFWFILMYLGYMNTLQLQITLLSQQNTSIEIQLYTHTYTHTHTHIYIYIYIYIYNIYDECNNSS